MVSGMKKLAVIASLVWTLRAAGADINLTPQPTVRELEGCKFPQLEFRDGTRKLTYELPKGWTYLPRDSQTLALIPPHKDSVSAKIKFIPTAGTLTLDEEQLRRLKETAPQLLPTESRIMLEPVITPNPLLFNDHPTCEIDVVFELYSHKLRMSVLFVDLGDSQLRFSLIARPPDFEELHKAFRESWYSWQWLNEGKN
jgi:hypothetical protein